MGNREIVNENLDLIRRCVECQFVHSAPDMQNMEDYYHDLILYLYDYPKLMNAVENNHLNALITKIVIQNLYSKTSVYDKVYRRFGRISDDLDDWQEETEEKKNNKDNYEDGDI